MKRSLMARWFIALVAALLSVVFTLLLPVSAAAQTLTREQALKQLSSKSADLRGAAVRRLGDIGRFADSNPLAKRLLDEDEDTREAAEAALWAVWSRSGDARADALFKKGVNQMNSAAADEVLKNVGKRAMPVKPAKCHSTWAPLSGRSIGALAANSVMRSVMATGVLDVAGFDEE